MTKEQIFEYFYTNSANLGIKSMLITLLAGLAIGLIIYATYYISYKGVAYNSKFNAALIVLLEISVLIMLMISSNIVISLGMVGALSIVRFRTAIKDSRDTVFIFWAIAEGLSIGSQNFKLALITTLFIALIMIALEYIPTIFNKYLVVIRGSNEADIADIINTTKKFTSNVKLRTSTSTKENQEVILEVKTKGELDPELIEEILKAKGIKSVNYIVENGESIG